MLEPNLSLCEAALGAGLGNVHAEGSRVFFIWQLSKAHHF